MAHFTANFNERFWQLRALLEKNRPEFDREFGFSAATIKKWETSIDNSFNPNILNNYIQIYRHLGVDVSYEWLVHGYGPAPKIRNPLSKIIDNAIDIMMEQPILPFFFMYDNELIIRKINPKYAHILSDQPKTQIEGSHLSNVLSKENLIIQQQIFTDAIDGINDPYKLYTPNVINNKIDLSLVCHVIKDKELPISALNYIAGGLVC